MGGTLNVDQASDQLSQGPNFLFDLARCLRQKIGLDGNQIQGNQTNDTFAQGDGFTSLTALPRHECVGFAGEKEAADDLDAGRKVFPVQRHTLTTTEHRLRLKPVKRCNGQYLVLQRDTNVTRSSRVINA